MKIPEWAREGSFRTRCLSLCPKAEGTAYIVMVQTSFKFVFYLKNSFSFVHFNIMCKMTFQLNYWSLLTLHTGLTGPRLGTCFPERKAGHNQMATGSRSVTNISTADIIFFTQVVTQHFRKL